MQSKGEKKNVYESQAHNYRRMVFGEQEQYEVESSEIHLTMENAIKRIVNRLC